MFIRGLFTIALAHFTASIIVALCTLGLSSAVGGAFLYMVFGALYLIAEVPFVVFSLWVLRHAKSRLIKVLVSVFIVLSAALLGAALTIKVEGSRPDDYLLGNILAGIAVGVITCISGLRFLTRTQKLVAN